MLLRRVGLREDPPLARTGILPPLRNDASSAEAGLLRDLLRRQASELRCLGQHHIAKSNLACLIVHHKDAWAHGHRCVRLRREGNRWKGRCGVAGRCLRQ